MPDCGMHNGPNSLEIFPAKLKRSTELNERNEKEQDSVCHKNSPREFRFVRV